MNKPHKYADVIKAWADGKDIQLRHKDKEEWADIKDPMWAEGCVYRIKPETLKYRVALMNLSGEIYTQTINNKNDEYNCEHRKWHFVKWLTEWTEVEI